MDRLLADAGEGLDIAVEPLTPLLAGITFRLAALISQWPGLRALNNLGIATVVRLCST